MKHTERILELVKDLGPEEMHEKLWEHVSGSYDAYCEYDIENDEIVFGRSAKGMTQIGEDGSRISVTGMPAWENSIDDGWFWNEDLFTPEEVAEISEDYDDDWEAWLSDHPETDTLAERCEEASLSLYQQRWYETLDEIREALTTD